MSEPTPTNPIISTRSTITGSTKETEALVGKHIISTGLIRINREWQPKDRAAQRFKDDVIRKLEQVLNNVSLGSEGESGGTVPDLVYDSGYWYFQCNPAGSNYVKTITHNMGQIPSRFTFFYANAAEPDPEINDIRVVVPRYTQHYDPTGTPTNFTSGFFCLTGPVTGYPINGNNQVVISISKHWLDGYDTYGIPPRDENDKGNGYMRVVMWR
jgi:hypothetical protein